MLPQLLKVDRLEIAEAFRSLGYALKSLPDYVIDTANVANNWFTPANIRIAAKQWSDSLTSDNIDQWFSDFTPSAESKNVGIIMAGNIPFVGLHDLLCVIASGHKALVKLSSQDEVLMGHAIAVLRQHSKYIDQNIEITESLNNAKALIATGSNNSSRYFEYYFRNIPTLIRKNRSSVAVLSGKETDEELRLLASDIYTYFGLGCRNVTHLLLPENMELKRLYEAYDVYMDIVHHHKYYNNYMYHKSILLMNLTKHYDNGFMLFQEKKDLHCPVATLNYHYYKDKSEVEAFLKEHTEEIQCVAANPSFYSPSVAFGQTQFPGLRDYADNVNTIEFLVRI